MLWRGEGPWLHRWNGEAFFSCGWFRGRGTHTTEGKRDGFVYGGGPRSTTKNLKK